LLLGMLPMPSFAEEEGFFKKTSIDVKLTYASKYLSKGYDLWENAPAFQPDIFIDLGATGLYAGVWSSYSLENNCKDPYGDKCADWDEHDYYAGYYNSMLDSSRFKTNYDISYTYYHFFRLGTADINELFLSVNHPEFLPRLGPSRPVPYWGLYYDWPAHGAGKEAWYLKAGVNYDIPIGENKITPSVEIGWDDGGGTFDTGHGWSYWRTALAGSFSWHGLRFEPSLYYQWSMKDSAPDNLLEDEFWFKMTVAFNVKPF